MSTLTFDQKKTLSAFEYFFEEKYNADDQTDNNTELHVCAQKMCYLLKTCNVEIGDYDFSWNFRGPFSPGLLVSLRSLDNNKGIVDEFYNGCDLENRKKSYLGEYYIERINEIKQDLKIKEHNGDISSWIEILGSLAYISRSIMPGADFERVNERLVKEKQQYSDIERNRDAWSTLRKVGAIN